MVHENIFCIFLYIFSFSFKSRRMQRQQLFSLTRDDSGGRAPSSTAPTAMCPVPPWPCGACPGAPVKAAQPQPASPRPWDAAGRAGTLLQPLPAAAREGTGSPGRLRGGSQRRRDEQWAVLRHCGTHSTSSQPQRSGALGFRTLHIFQMGMCVILLYHSSFEGIQKPVMSVE